MTITELAPPLGEPLTLAETKTHLRVETSADDGLLTALIATVRDYLSGKPDWRF